MVSLYRWHQFWRVINKLLQPLPSGRPPAAEGVLQLSAREASHINTQRVLLFQRKALRCKLYQRPASNMIQVPSSEPRPGNRLFRGFTCLPSVAPRKCRDHHHHPDLLHFRSVQVCFSLFWRWSWSFYLCLVSPYHCSIGWYRKVKRGTKFVYSFRG